MQTKTLTTFGCLLMLAATIAPAALAHTQGQNGPLGNVNGTDEWVALTGGSHNPTASPAGPSGWYDGAVAFFARLTSVDEGGVTDQSVCDNLTDPDQNEACHTLLSPVNPGFTFAAANALCDVEILSDGDVTTTTDNGLDEKYVDSAPLNAAGTADGVTNDGGSGAVCHTFADVAAAGSQSAQDGYYVTDAYNTGNCPAATASAYAYDLAIQGDVWIQASCDDSHTDGGAGIVNTLVGCVSGAVLTVHPLDLVGCVNQALNCLGLLSGPCASVGGTLECGADNSADLGGTFGTGGAGVPYPGVESDAQGSCAAFGAAAVFVFNGVDVDFDGSTATLNNASVATHGWAA